MKRFLSLILCLMLVMSLCAPAFSSEDAAGAGAPAEESAPLPERDGEGLPVSGVWGALAWAISDDGVLTVSGSGDMEPFDGDANRPWHPYIGEIKKAVFGEGITSIAPYALTVCNKLTEIVLPSTLKTIGSGAFYGNPMLESIEFPEGLETIGSDAFGSCTGLKSITLPDSVKELGSVAFWGCGALESAVLGDGLTQVSEETFRDCASLRSVAFGKNIRTVGQAAFSHAGLTSLSLPEGLESLDGSAFFGCASLASVTVPVSIKSIGSSAFANDTNLETVYYAGTEEDWYAIRILGDNDPLWNAVGYTMRYSGTMESGVRWVLEGTTLTVSGDGAIDSEPWFSYASSIRTAVIEEGIIGIGDSAFNNCVNLDTIYIPLSVRRIGIAAIPFVKRIEYPGTMEQWRQIEIDEGNAYSIEYRGMDPNYSGDERYSTRVTVTAQTPSRAMQEGISLMAREGFGISRSVEYALEVELSTDGGETWFAATERDLPEKGVVIRLPYPGGTSPEKQDFIAVWVNPSNGWSGATPTEEPDGLVLTIQRLDNIGVAWVDTEEPVGSGEEPADSGWFDLINIGWRLDSDGVLHIFGSGNMPDFTATENGDTIEINTPWYALRDRIVKIEVATGITGVGAMAFRNLENVTEAELPEGLSYIRDGAFYGCLRLDHIDLPSTLRSIGEGTFMWCPFRQITFPAGLKSIGAHCFDMNELEEIVLPEGIEYIGAAAFSPNEYVTALTVPAGADLDDEDGENGPFTGLYGLKTITVSEGVTEIPPRCFSHCFAVTEIKLPSTIETLGHDFILLTLGGEKTRSELESITVAPREGFDFAGWTDESGETFTSGEIVSGAPYTGDLKAVWVKSFGEDTFSDVSRGAWYYDSVGFVYRAGLMVGVSNTSFRPGGSGTRAQAVTILHRLAGEPEASGASGFSDVPEGQWYSDAVAWAAQNGITSGYEDGTFRPNRAVTRQELVTLMLHMAEYLGIAFPDDRWEDSYLDAFPDAASVAAWARPAENWSVGVGFQNGSAGTDGITRLEPTRSVTRAELAVFFTRFCADGEAIRELDAEHYLRDADES